MKLFELIFFFFFQAEDGIRDADVTGVQTCALPIFGEGLGLRAQHLLDAHEVGVDLLEDVGDALEIHAPIETGAAMDVVARNGKVHTKTLRSSSTTVNLSTERNRVVLSHSREDLTRSRTRASGK